MIPKMGPETSSRVVIPITEGNEIMTLALAMSRTMGDPEGKKANLVIADPNVEVIDLKKLKEGDAAEGGGDSQYFVVVASDGVLDKIPPLQVAQRIAQSFYHETPSRPLLACRELIQQASQMWMSGVVGYRDDISISVKKILM